MRGVLEAVVVLPLELYVLEQLTGRVRRALGSTRTEGRDSERRDNTT